MARIFVTKTSATKKNGKLRKGCRRIKGTSAGRVMYSCPSSVIKSKSGRKGRFKRGGKRH